MVAHNGVEGRDFPIDELRRVLTEHDARKCGFDLESAKLTEELRLAAIRDQAGIWAELEGNQ